MTSNVRFETAFLTVAGGQFREAPRGDRVLTDSREDVTGALFVALTGPNFDGHDFVEEVLERGAGGAVVSERWWRGAGKPTLPLWIVEDTLSSLQRLAHEHRRRIPIPLVALTGSSGKTTTKELLAAALSSMGEVLKTRGNRNNHIGVPLTLLELERRHAVAVVELGMNRPGEIRMLSTMAAPDVVMITNVSEAHLGGVGDRSGVARAKAEIVDGLRDGGSLVLPAGDEDLEAALAKYRGARRTFGLGSDADVRPDHIELSETGVTFTLEGASVWSPLVGEHAVRNILAALTAAGELGVSWAKGAKALAAVEAAPGRLRPRPAGGVIILDDTYNANPDSLRAALAVLERFPAAGKRWAVLGDMLELGDREVALHRESGLGLAFVDGLITVGKLARDLGRAATEAGLPPENHLHVSRAAEAAATLRPRLGPGDVVLVKGSRGMRLEVAVDALIAALEGEG